MDRSFVAAVRGGVVKRPGLPSDEAARLAALREHDVLDTGADDAIDAVTRTVVRLLGVPIALVSLVDVDRQWFKSRHGLSATETARDISFCGHVVAESTPLIVADARSDERFADNPLVLGDPKIRFYAGYPLRTAEGHDLGTLCAIDSRPRAPSDAELATLADLSRVVVALLAGHRDRARLERKRILLEQQARQLTARSELLATISHEIRTPLHGVVGIANLLAESDLPADQRDLLETLVRSAGAVRRIVDDVLDLARAESNKLPIHPRDTDVWTLLEDVVDLYASELGVRGVEIGLVVDEGAQLSLQVDGTRLQQIVSNLVGNAAKFTREGAIAVRVATRRETSGRVTLTLGVEDTGPGFPPDVLARPFAAFSQPDNTLARLHGGSGLGLAIAGDLARRMGGELRIDPSYERGARLVLTLHDLQPAMTAPADEMSSAPTVGLALGFRPMERAALMSALQRVPSLAVTLVEDVADIEAHADARFVLAPLDRTALLERSLPTHAALVHACSPGSVVPLPPGAAAMLRLPFRQTRLWMLAKALGPPAATSTPAPATEAPKRTAFVVDDDQTSVRLLAAMLRRRGFVVTTFSEAAAALAACRTKALPELVFSDLHMPYMNGLELAARLRAELPRPPRLIVVSATVRDDDRLRCEEAGYDAFLAKPFIGAELDALTGASPTQHPAGDDAELVVEARLADVVSLLGDDAAEVIAEGRAVTDQHLEALLRHAKRGGPELTHAAHAIGSACIQLGMVVLGERAREIEYGAAEMSSEERVRAVQSLSALAARSHDAFERALARLTRGTSPRLVRICLAGEVDGDRLIRQLETTTHSVGAEHVLLVDGRASTPTDPSVGAAFERWYQTPPETVVKIALLVQNRLWIPHIEARALGCPVPMRAFEDEADALRWLGES